MAQFNSLLQSVSLYYCFVCRCRIESNVFSDYTSLLICRSAKNISRSVVYQMIVFQVKVQNFVFEAADIRFAWSWSGVHHYSNMSTVDQRGKKLYVDNS